MNRKVLVGVSALAVVWLSALMACAENVAVTDNARKHFQSGVAYLEEPTGARYEDAYLEFHAAYSESPSYKILNNIGLCALFLERDGEAIDAYEQYLAAAPAEEIPADKRKQIESDIKRLKSGLVTLTLKVSPDNATVLDSRLAVQGTNIANRYTAKNGELTIGIHPGRHRITVTAEGGKEQSWEFDAAPGSTHNRSVNLATSDGQQPTPAASGTVANVTVPPVDKPAGGPSTGAYVGLAVTGVFAAATTTMGLLALSKKSDLETLNKEQKDHAAAQDAYDGAKRFGLFCDIGIGATAVAAGVTTYLFLSGGKSKEKSPERSSFVQWTPVLSPGAAGVNVTGRF